MGERMPMPFITLLFPYRCVLKVYCKLDISTVHPKYSSQGKWVDGKQVDFGEHLT